MHDTGSVALVLHFHLIWHIFLSDAWSKDEWKKRSGAVGARWAHNPEVVGSKPTFAILFFLLSG